MKPYDIVKYNDKLNGLMRVHQIHGSSLYGTNYFGFATCRECGEVTPASEEDKLLYKEMEKTRKAPDLEALAIDVFKWQKFQFPDKTKEGVLKHLKDEMQEFIDSEDPEELADVFIMMLAYFDINKLDLAHTTWQKLLVNFDRDWPEKPNADGVYPHIES